MSSQISLDSDNSYKVDLQQCGESDDMPLPPQERQQQQRRSSRRSSGVSRRRSSGVVSFEFHDSLVFEELSAMIDEEDAQEDARDAAAAAALLNKEITCTADADGDFPNSASSGGGSRSSRLGLPRGASEISQTSFPEVEDEDDDDAPIVTKIERNIIGREIRAGNKLVRTRSDACFADSARFPRTGSAMGLNGSGSKSTSRLSTSRVASFGADTEEEMSSNLSALQNETFAASTLGRKDVNKAATNKSAASAGRSLLGALARTPSMKNRLSKPFPNPFPNGK